MGRGLVLVLFSLLAFAQQTRDLRMEREGRPGSLPDRGKRWAVVVGISSYQHLPPAAQLNFAHRDAEEFASFLRSAAGGGIPGDHIRLLTNEQATAAQVRAAVHVWLPESAGADDMVYFFFAGHGVLDDNDEGYFVAYDSDPQNLHATAVGFQEVDRTLSRRLRAGLAVLVVDACHAGRLGWSSFAAAGPSRAGDSLAAIGQGDRSFLKLLAARPTERSYEDKEWDGGHGIFTHSLVEGLRGDADRDGDRVVRASEAIDYVSRRVPELTDSRQHPRVAGTFDARAPLAVSLQPVVPASRTATLDVSGPPQTAVYIDSIFRGAIRAAGVIRVESVPPGAHSVSADFPNGSTLDGSFSMEDKPARITLAVPVSSPLAQLQARVDADRILEPGGAWEMYRSQSFAGPQQAAATALISGALEQLGQACVGDYVQSPSSGLKKIMLRRAVDALERLQTIRTDDSALEVKRLFCRGRLEIAEGRFSEAVPILEASLKLDSRFACSYNALGVALARLNRPREAQTAFETAAKFAPEWGLPPFQIASQLVAAGDLARAVPYLEKALAFNPRSTGIRWSLMHAHRVLGHLAEVEKQAAEFSRLGAPYAPAYLELGQAYEAAGNSSKAAEAYDSYVLLAPNFADTNEVRARAERLRRPRPVPTLRR